MSDNRKEQERAELHRAIWNIANDLRGSVDGWDFKQYVLGVLFYRYISENLAGYINAGEREAGVTAFKYAKLPDSYTEQARDDLVKTKGFFILQSELFENVRQRAAGDENINETMERVFKNIEASARGTDSEDDKFHIGHGDTLTDPLHEDDEPFEAIIAEIEGENAS